MEVFAVVADPIRRRILELLAEGERTAGELGAEFDVRRPAVSRHLRVLREAGLVDCRKDAQRRVYRLNATPLEQLDRWLERYRGFWSEKLDALQAHLEEG
jgi:DNA-binding transcriptional ArsR family regulator